MYAKGKDMSRALGFKDKALRLADFYYCLNSYIIDQGVGEPHLGLSNSIHGLYITYALPTEFRLDRELLNTQMEERLIEGYVLTENLYCGDGKFRNKVTIYLQD